MHAKKVPAILVMVWAVLAFSGTAQAATPPPLTPQIQKRMSFDHYLKARAHHPAGVHPSMLPIDGGGRPSFGQLVYVTQLLGNGVPSLDPTHYWMFWSYVHGALQVMGYEPKPCWCAEEEMRYNSFYFARNQQEEGWWYNNFRPGGSKNWKNAAYACLLGAASMYFGSDIASRGPDNLTERDAYYLAWGCITAGVGYAIL